MPGWFFALMAFALVAQVGATVAASSLLGWLAVPLLLLLTLLLSHLRLSVTASHVHVQLGLFGPKIPLSAVQSAGADHYAPLRCGGWGIRYAGGVWGYSVPGGRGDAVEVVWVDGHGARRTHVITCEDGPAMARAIAAGAARAREVSSSGVRMVPANEMAHEGGDAAGAERAAADARTKRAR